MAKKRTILSRFVTALLAIVMMLALFKFPVTAKAISNSETETTKFESTIVGIVTATKLNVRNDHSTDSRIIGQLENGTVITVEEIVKTSDTVNAVWLKIKYNGKVGYVSGRYVDMYKDQYTDVGIVTTNLNLREKPTTENSKVKRVLPKGECVNILNSRTPSKKSGKWYQVISSDGNVGWVSGKYLNIGEWTLLSTATTRSNSVKNRDHNIALVCSFINGEVILPEDDFSWFKTVGACSSEKGFLEATVYSNGKVSTGYGGGVCQVSTTINMAAKKAGIKTNARQHSLPVSYAKREDEATVSYPYQNFSFENTLQNPIMLEVTSSYGSCTCNVYVLE